MRTSLGQNFLANETIAEKIVNSAGLSNKNNILEIGPGKGILTKYLGKYAGKVLALEIDRKLITELSLKHIQDETSIKIIEGDILKINLPQLLKKNNFENYKVVANLPYYITSKIIRLMLETKYPPSEMILMVQKEVGERIVALNKKESLLSISVKFYAEPEILFYVTKENFKPLPKVDSAVIRIKRKKNIPNVNTKKFFQIVRAGFSSKRKMLINNLSASFHIPKNQLLEWIKKSGLEPRVRAEKLELEEWIKLYTNFNNPKSEK
mgnify:CR=1 FL=1